MKKNLPAIVIASMFAFGLGLGVNNIAMSDVDTSKIAYVNVAKLLSSSKSLKSAQEAKQKQEKEMLQWFKTASADINKQQTQAGKDALIKKYEGQLKQKKKTISEQYIKKVNEIDKQIAGAISTKATALGYSMVLKKDSVVFGGVDMTDSVLPLIK